MLHGYITKRRCESSPKSSLLKFVKFKLLAMNCTMLTYNIFFDSLMQCRSIDGEIAFSTDIPELMIEDAVDAEDMSSPHDNKQAETQRSEGSPGLKSVLSTGRSLSCESSEKPVVTFKENIKPQEVNRELPARSYTRTVNAGKEQRDYNKGMNAVGNKKENNNKRKNDPKKTVDNKNQEPAKQSIAVQVCVPMETSPGSYVVAGLKKY